MPSNLELPSSRQRPALTSLQLQSWPPRDEAFRTLGVAAFEILAAVLAGSMTGRWTTGLLVGVLLGVASWELWVPMRYELGPKGIIRWMPFRRRRILWSEFTHYEVQAHGVFLRHYTDQQPFGAMRGLFLPSRAPHAELLPALDQYLKPRLSDPAATTQTLIP